MSESSVICSKTAKSDYKLRHVFLPVCPSVRPAVRIDLHKILYSSIFAKFVEKIQVSYKSEKMTCTLYEYQCTFTITSPLIFLEREIFRTKFLAKIKAHFYAQYFFFDNRAFYEIM